MLVQWMGRKTSRDTVAGGPRCGGEQYEKQVLINGVDHAVGTPYVRAEATWSNRRGRRTPGILGQSFPPAAAVAWMIKDGRPV